MASRTRSSGGVRRRVGVFLTDYTISEVLQEAGAVVAKLDRAAVAGRSETVRAILKDIKSQRAILKTTYNYAARDWAKRRLKVRGLALRDWSHHAYGYGFSRHGRRPRQQAVDRPRSCFGFYTDNYSVVSFVRIEGHNTKALGPYR